MTVLNNSATVTDNYQDHCDSLAAEIFKNVSVISRKVLHDIESVRYTTAVGSLILCYDGGALFAEGYVSPYSHQIAFSIGMRTSESAIASIF